MQLYLRVDAFSGETENHQLIHAALPRANGDSAYPNIPALSTIHGQI
jgi:hypothetical protein